MVIVHICGGSKHPPYKDETHAIGMQNLSKTLHCFSHYICVRLYGVNNVTLNNQPLPHQGLRFCFQKSCIEIKKGL